MKDIKTHRGGARLIEMIHQGEHLQQDFKFRIDDARKISRSISAFANCAGGRLLIGVKDNGEIAGVRDEEDIYVVEQAATLYCTPAQDIEFDAMRTSEGRIVIVASVTKSPSRPVLSQDSDKKWRAYYRVADENIAAHPLMVRTWKYQASTPRCSFNISGPEAAILDYLRSQAAPVSVSEALLVSGASRRAAEWAIVRLAALGLVQFTHAGNLWHLTLPQDDI